jgi:hypothetical protein
VKATGQVDNLVMLEKGYVVVNYCYRCFACVLAQGDQLLFVAIFSVEAGLIVILAFTNVTMSPENLVSHVPRVMSKQFIMIWIPFSHCKFF